MSGKRYFLDTNAIIQLLAGNSTILELLKTADHVATSVICELEFLSFPDLPEEDRQLFRLFKERVQVVDILSDDDFLKNHILAFRFSKKMKLPDAIIAAAAKSTDCILLTADNQLLNHPDVTSQGFSITSKP